MASLTVSLSEIDLTRLEQYSCKQTKDQEISPKLETLSKSVESFIWDECKLLGGDDRSKIPAFLIRLTEAETNFFLPKTQFKNFQFKLKNLKPAVVAREYTLFLLENLSFSNEGYETCAIYKSLANIIGVIFNQTYSNEPNNWTIGDDDISNAKTLNDSIIPLKTLEKTSASSEIIELGLLDHTFYLASKKLKSSPEKKVRLLYIWFHSAKNLDTRRQPLLGFRAMTIILAKKENKILHKAVRNAWKQIGLKA